VVFFIKQPISLLYFARYDFVHGIKAGEHPTDPLAGIEFLSLNDPEAIYRADIRALWT
jgi:hypothetical protein